MDFVLNGRPASANGISAHTTLLEYLRDTGLTGTKEGCAEGECGACAVLLVSPDGERSRYRAVNSCLLLLPSLAGQEVYTVEGLGCHGRLSEPQRAIAEGGGSQCGYCTPGFVVSLFAEYYRPGRTGPCDPHAMGGNLCRCTGYRPLRDAALSLGEAPSDGFRERLDRPAPPLAAYSFASAGESARATPMDQQSAEHGGAGIQPAERSPGYAGENACATPMDQQSAEHGGAGIQPAELRPRPASAGSRFERPASLADCVVLLSANREARIVAGATGLAVEANLRGTRWPMLISVEGVPELKTISETADAIEIGAGLTLSEIEERWTSPPPAVRGWFELFASPLIRNRATLGGNLATASPVGDAAPLLLALDAEVRIFGPDGARSIPLSGFFPGYRQTGLRSGEVIVAVRIPKPLPARFAFYKAAKRVMDDISTVAAAFAIDTDPAGRITRARAAYGGVAATPVLVRGFEQSLLGRSWNQSAVLAAQHAVAGSLAPLSDHRGSAAYRLALAQSLIEKFWWETREAHAA
jgi:xanthine dehydrogenase small subunit